MSRATVLVLFLLVAGLGYAAWRQLRAEEREEKASDVALFEGVDPARVERLLVENLERDQHLAFDRDENGRWLMTEPMRIPAEQAVVQRLFDILLDRRATPVPAGSARPEELHLVPPRVILEIEEEVLGARRRTRVDLGSPDIDGSRVNVLARGRVLRTWRDIDTALDRPLEDYMSHEIVELPPNDVVEIHRTGSIRGRTPGTTSDLAFDAVLEDDLWRATAPVVAPVDPDAARLLVQGLLGLRAVGFADLGSELRSDLGLDPPEITWVLGTSTTRMITLRFGRPGHDPGREWNCSVDGRDLVWTVAAHPVELFSSPPQTFLDARVARVPIASVDAVSLVLEGRELRLWREKVAGPPEGRWKVSERPGPEAAFTPGAPADLRRVEDLVGRIAALEIASFLFGETLTAGEVRGSITVRADGAPYGGEVGAEVGTAERGRALRFHRQGDSIAALADPALVEILRTPLEDLLTLTVVSVDEILLKQLVISGAGSRRVYVRGSTGLWTPPEVAVEARELHGVLDALTLLRASKRLAAGALAPFSDPIEVELKDAAGIAARYTVGIAPGAPEAERVQVDCDGRRSVLRDQGLHERLSAVLKKGS